MRLEIDIPEHHYNNIMALDSVSLGRVPYKGIIMYSINAIKHGKVLEQEPTTKNETLVSRDEVCRYVAEFVNHEFSTREEEELIDNIITGIERMPSVTPQEPRCKDCKWWKDSDGEYRRGIGAESQCPINRREVFEGSGYCYMFEPQESEDKECI